MIKLISEWLSAESKVSFAISPTPTEKDLLAPSLSETMRFVLLPHDAAQSLWLKVCGQFQKSKKFETFSYSSANGVVSNLNRGSKWRREGVVMYDSRYKAWALLAPVYVYDSVSEFNRLSAIMVPEHPLARLEWGREFLFSKKGEPKRRLLYLDFLQRKVELTWRRSAGYVLSIEGWSHVNSFSNSIRSIRYTTAERLQFLWERG